jgi:hypothetical protein
MIVRYVVMVSAGVMGAISLGSTIMGGVSKMAGASVNADAQKIGIQGQMMQTMAQAFGFQAQAQQSKYASNISKYQAGVADINKEIAKGNAIYSRDVGEVEAGQAGMKAHADMGEMIAQQGASGISVNSGSSARVRESMVEIGQYTQSIIRSSAAKKAYGYEVEAMQYGAQADVYRYTSQQQEAQAENAMTASDITKSSLGLQQQAMSNVDSAKNINIMGSLVGTAGSVANKWSEGGYSGLTSAVSGMFG